MWPRLQVDFITTQATNNEKGKGRKSSTRRPRETLLLKRQKLTKMGGKEGEEARTTSRNLGNREKAKRATKRKNPARDMDLVRKQQIEMKFKRKNQADVNLNSTIPQKHKGKGEYLRKQNPERRGKIPAGLRLWRKGRSKGQESTHTKAQAESRPCPQKTRGWSWTTNRGRVRPPSAGSKKNEKEVAGGSTSGPKGSPRRAAPFGLGGRVSRTSAE